MMMNSSFRQRKRARTAGKGVQKTALVAVSKKQAEENLARKVVQLSKYVKGLKPEMKFADLTMSSSNVPTATGYTQLMSAIAAGTGVNQRVGENVQIKYLELHFQPLYTNSVDTAVNENPSYRFFIVQDKQQISDTTPDLTDLLDQPATPSLSLFNVSEQKRFRVIYDSGPQTVTFGVLAADMDSSISFPGKLNFTVKRNVSITTQFNGTASTDIQKNGIYFMIQSNMVSVAPAACFDFQCTTRVGYIDV